MADEPTSLVRYSTDAGAEVAVLNFHHGPLNLFDQAMFDAVAANVADLTANPPRAVLLRADGKVNSAGVDVHVFDGLSAQQGADMWRQLFADIAHPLEALPCPVVYAAHGLTLTAAFEISLACDFRIVSETCRYALPEQKLGQIPGSGGSARRNEHILPNSDLAVSLATLASFQARDSRLYDGVGIDPDLQMEPEPEFFVNQSDRILERAIELIRASPSGS